MPPTVSMLTCLIACFLVAGSSPRRGRCGRRPSSSPPATAGAGGRGPRSGGALLLTLLYWWAFLVFAGLTLGLLGADGGSCPCR